MIKEISIKQIDDFIAFGDNIYKDDKNYVPYIIGSLKKELKKLVFEKKTYKAICYFDESNAIKARVLLSIGHSKQLNSEKCGYFSHFEIINNQSVFNEFMDHIISVLKDMGAEYICGPFYLHDPDNRRGVLVDGFEYSPMLFTSHNPVYYKELFENYGFKKLIDALEYEYHYNQETVDRIKTLSEQSIKEYDYHVDHLNYKNIDKDIEDVHTIMEIASTKINFENVLSKEEIKKIFNGWKMFIDPDYALVARTNKDNKPIGFVLCIPNYNELIRKIKGRINLKGVLTFIFEKKKIKSLRAILQYVIPDYQHKGISKSLYYEIFKSVQKNGVNRISLGTIMENNDKSNGAIKSLGGELSRTYRVYYKEIENK